MNERNRLSAFQIPRVFHGKFLWVVLLLVCLGTPALHGADTREQKVAVLVSLKIRPYVEAVEGLKEYFSEQSSLAIKVFNMENYKGNTLNILSKDLRDEKFDLCIAVGPEAARFVWTSDLADQGRKLYTMVLNPDKIVELTEPACGIPLDIPAEIMMQIFSKVLPSLKRIGLLYDPENNSEFARRAVLEAAVVDLEIIPLEVSLRKQIPDVLKKNWAKIDRLWLIPDQTIITESLVRYIIKEAISNGVSVFGYNRFFYTSGAAVCFVLDYQAIGRQTAQLSLALLRGQDCEKQMPVFKIWYNLRVLNMLGIDLVIDPSLGMEIEPGP
jgi:putative ABC transport system substrate-binding protein